MRRSAPQTPPREQRSRKTFTIIGTTALGCTLALSPALPAFNTAPAALAHEEHGAGAAQAEPRSYTGNYIVRGVHTELLNAELHNGKLALNSKAETQDGEGLFNPSTTVFNLPANDQSQTRVAAGYDFIAPEGTPIWYISQKHTDGLLYPGFSAENIPQGALKNNKITVDLIKSEVPEGARAEVFQENLSGASRMFSTADRLAPYELEAVLMYMPHGRLPPPEPTGSPSARAPSSRTARRFTLRRPTPLWWAKFRRIFSSRGIGHKTRRTPPNQLPLRRSVRRAVSRRIGMLPRMSAHQRKITARVIPARSIR